MSPQQQGIMALPESDQAPPPPLSLDESYDAVQQGLQKASPQASQMLNQAMQQFKPMLKQFDDKTLDSLVQVVQYLKQIEAQYPELLKQLIDKGVLKPGVFPDQYDPEFLATLLLVLMSEKTDRQQSSQQPEMAPPPGMARGGIAEAARSVMKHGRSGDTILAHINPREVEILKAHGGMGTINPTTGLPEYSFWSDPIGSVSQSLSDAGDSVSHAFNDLGTSVRDFASTPLGNIAVTVGLAMVLGPMVGPAMALGLGSAGSTLIGGGSLKDAVINGSMAYFAAPGGAVSNFVGGAVTNVALNAAVTGGLVGTAGGLLRGKSLEDSVKAGLTQAAISGATTGLTEGFTTQGKYGPAGASGNASVTSGASATGTDVSQGTQTGVRSFANESELGAAMKNGEVTAGQNFTLGGNRYIYTPKPGSPDYFTQVDTSVPSTAANSVGTGTYTEAQRPQLAQDINSGKLGSGDIVSVGGNTVRIHIPNGSDTAYFTPVSTAATRYTGGIDPAVAKMAAAPAPSTGFQFSNSSDAANRIASGAPAFGEAAGSNVPGIQRVDAPATVSGPPTYGEAFKNMYGGVKQMLPGTGGSFGEGASQFATGAEQLFSPSLSKAELMKTPEYQSAISKGSSIGSALKEAAETNTPGMIRSYAPGVTAALGTAYALGAFDEKPPQKDEQQMAMDQRLADERARVAANPGAYVPQGMQRFGLTYNDKGQLTGSGSWNPYEGINPSTVNSTQFVAYTPSKYLGIASLASGGYPRRTGQIAGPGTETSDSIPAMLSDGEFVMTAKAVRGAGKGSRLAGAKKMYSLMHQLERNASRK